jgi:hypothetical protein
VASVNSATGGRVSLSGLARFTIIAATMRQLPMKNAMKIDLKGMASLAALGPNTALKQNAQGDTTV